ncbi:hypothetical protein CGC50_10920 [Capnocytophaga gingivalis]|jgi:hypothetical protein|uniref:Uncharacterized protein n=1 Tax=Capnocytophaga gingivalis TaxID=1017 RepID=A0A250FUI6_9FLAO|nr:hypothetical protein [Capnocytophaga gingivalis]ATA87617.1 hypothetical protein CGC50_10920 [Capnocytophaga gingivalis]
MTRIELYVRGGGSTNGYLMRYIMRIRNKLKEIAPNLLITPEIRLDFAVRIDGIFFTYGDPAGCSHLKFFKKKGFIAITIAVTLKEDALPVNELLDFFRESLFTGFSQMFDRLLKDKYILDKEALMNFIKENIDSIQKPTEDSL